MSTVNFLQDYRLYDFFTNSNRITLYKNGKNQTYEKSSPEYTAILDSFLETIRDSNEMPAFGVSLHDLTVKSMEQGTWIKFEFPEQMEHSEMPFDALLVNVVANWQGFNIIRELDGEYTGRCYYLDLNQGTMQELYDTCENIKISKNSA